MAAPPRLKDRVFTGLTLLAAVAVAVIGLSRGNAKVGLVGAGVLLGYAGMNAVSRRLVPAARLVTGQEADAAERLAQYRALVLTGRVAVGAAVLGVVLAATDTWDAGLWVAGTAAGVVATFVLGLWWFSRRAVSDAPVR